MPLLQLLLLLLRSTVLPPLLKLLLLLLIPLAYPRSSVSPERFDMCFKKPEGLAAMCDTRLPSCWRSKCQVDRVKRRAINI
jgi:hypothetical protein